MKRLFLTIAIVLTTVLLFGQATNTRVVRVASNTTDFGENLPKGTYVYDLTAKILYVLDAGATSTDDLTSVGANKTAINAAPSTEVQDEAYNSTNFDNDLTHAVSQDDFYDYQHTGDTDDDALVNKVDLSSAGIVKTDASGVLSSSTVNLASSTDVGTSILPIANGGTNSSTALTNDKVMISSSGSIVESATISTTELGYLNGITGIDQSATNEGSLTVVAGGADDSQIQSNTSGSTNVTISGGTGIAVTEAGSTITIAYDGTAVTTRITQWVEVAADDLTQPYPVTLTQTPNATTKITVQINGVPLKYQAGTTNGTFNYSGTSLSIYSNVYQYDQIEIDYEY